MYLFLSGAEMQPERIRPAWPEARFVARGRLEPVPSGAEDEMWGIVIEISDGNTPGETRGAVTDDGRTFSVVVRSPDDTDPAAVVAAARYWELPPAYVRRLMAAAAMTQDDPSDG